MAALEAGDKENLPGSGRLRRRMDPGIDFASGEEETQPLRGGGVKCRVDGIGRWFTRRLQWGCSWTIWEAIALRTTRFMIRTHRQGGAGITSQEP